MEGAFRAKLTFGQASLEVEGTEQFVRDQLEAFEKRLLASPTPVGPPPAPAPGPSPVDKPNIKVFLEEKAPGSDQAAAAVVAYYLKTFQGIEEITPSLLSEWFTKGGRKPPKSPKDTLLNAKKLKGYFDKGSGVGAYRLSDAGIYLVERELGAAKVANA